MKQFLLTIGICLFTLGMAVGQVSLTDGSKITIDFSTTVSGVNNGAFDGSGFTTPPSAGQLDSDAWALTGFGNNVAFGGTATSGDMARGSSTGGVSTGGVYSFDVGSSNYILGVQPGEPDFTPGTITLKITNNTGSTITEFDIAYDIWEYNDQGRSSSLNFAHSLDNTTYTDVGALDYTTTEVAAGSPAWVSTNKSTTITGLNIIDGASFYLRWTGDDVSGSGSRDEYGIDDIEIIPTLTVANPATKLAVTEITPENPSVGTEISVTVQAKDASDNPANVSGDVDVTLSLATGTGSLAGTLTGTIADGTNEITISGVTYDNAESGVSITATDDASYLTAATSSTFEVLAAAGQLVFESFPTDGLNGKAVASFTVKAQRSGDSSTDLNYTKSITLAKVSGSGTLGGTLTKAAVSGVATFDDITFTGIASYTINATDGSLTSANSSSITIIVEPHIEINEILADPASGLAGDANGDGTRDGTDDEFVELVNTGSSDLDISNWVLSDGADRHTFAASTTLKPGQAVVVFGGGTPTGTFGNSLVFTATTGNLGLANGGDDVILKNADGVTVKSYTYGSEGDNDESLSRDPDLTGNFERHSSISGVTALFSPGTKSDGTYFGQSVVITGSEGWRMLSTPTSDNTYDDLLGDIWTQGIGTGADATNGTANVQLFDNATDNFVAVTDLTANMTPGVGFITYVYSDDDFDGSADGFPKTLSMFGTENTGTVTPTLNTGNDAWSLVGNPYNSSIDWDDLGKTNLTGTVYVYDHSYGTPSGADVAASGSSGSYRVWNGSAGSLTNGLLTPFQGFWVQNVASVTGTPELSIEEADTTTGGTFYKEVPTPTMKFVATMGNLTNDAYFSFTPEGEIGKDNYDGLELSPLDLVDYLTLSTVVGSETMDINNLPIALENEISVPVQIKAYTAHSQSGKWIPATGEVTLTWPELSNIPEGWTVTLHDYGTGEAINVKDENSYTFMLEVDGSSPRMKTIYSELNPVQVTKEKSNPQSRLGITIEPGTPVSNEDELATVTEFDLEQNYPNPFNPTTTIKYSVGEAGPVSLTVYNVMGQKVAELINTTKTAGTYQVNWNATGQASGIYYYRLQSPGQVITRQMTLIK